MGSDRATSASITHAWPAALRAKARAAARRAEQYLSSRQSANGGFCFYRWLGVDEPSLHDTCHAVAAFTLLGVEVPRRDEVVAFLRGFRITGFDDLYHHAQALDWLGHDEAPAWVALDRIRQFDAAVVLADEHVSVTGRLEHALRIVVLQRRFAVISTPDVIADHVRALQRDGGWGDKPNLGDTWLALAVLDACGARGFGSEARDFIDILQVASFGFTATRDSLYANLDTVHAGIRACAALGLPMRYANDAVGFVLACQTDEGGFARTSDALPNIGLAHRGLLALFAAGALPVRNTDEAHSDAGC